MLLYTLFMWYCHELINISLVILFKVSRLPVRPMKILFTILTQIIVPHLQIAFKLTEDIHMLWFQYFQTTFLSNVL